MAELPAPPTPAADPIDAQIAAARAALEAAQIQLVIDQSAEIFAPSPANAAAVKALTQRVSMDSAALASLLKTKAGESPPTSTSGGGGGTPPPVTFQEPSPTGAYGGTLGGIPKVPIVGVVLGTTGAAVEDWWGTGVLDLESLMDTEVSLESIAASALETGTEITVVEVGGGLVASIADLPLIALAGGAVIITYMVGKIITYVGRLFPNPSIFGWHPLNFIQGGLQDVGQGLVDVADGIMAPLKGIILTPIHLVKALFQRVVNAIASAHNKIAKVVTVTIPAAEEEAITRSKAYTDQQLQGIDPEEINKRITGISNTLGEVKQATQLNTAKIDGVSALGAVGLTAVVATISKVLTDLKTHVDTCTVDNCDQTSPNNIHNVLKGIFEGILATAEIAYVAAAIVDPVTQANLQAPGFEAIDASAVNLLNQILSL